MKIELAPIDILSLESYENVRADKRQQVRETMRDRRIEVGPFANFIFETYDSIWLQVHEMLRIEKGGEAQISDELSAYNPLIPKGTGLSSTLFFEISESTRRHAELSKLGGIENTIRLRFGDHDVEAIPDDDTSRTNDAGKTSAVHFLNFPFTPEQRTAFVAVDADVTLSFGHPGYRHSTVLSPQSYASLCRDFAST
jgi:hypothetical protein